MIKLKIFFIFIKKLFFYYYKKLIKKYFTILRIKLNNNLINLYILLYIFF